MVRVVPWARQVGLIVQRYPDGRMGRAPFALEVMLRTHFPPQWCNLKDLAIEDVFFDIPPYRDFVDLGVNERLPDERIIPRLRHLLEEHGPAARMLAEANADMTEHGRMLKEGSAVDATLIATQGPIKNKNKARNPEMHFSQKGSQ